MAHKKVQINRFRHYIQKNAIFSSLILTTGVCWNHIFSQINVDSIYFYSNCVASRFQLFWCMMIMTFLPREFTFDCSSLQINIKNTLFPSLVCALFQMEALKRYTRTSRSILNNSFERERVCWRDGWLMSQNQYPLLKSDNLMSHICQRNGISLNPNSRIYEFVSLGSVVLHPCIRCDMPCKNVSVIKLMNGKMCRERKKTPPTNRLFATYWMLMMVCDRWPDYLVLILARHSQCVSCS